MTDMLLEGRTNFFATKGKVATKKLEVFYNPVMKYNRDTTIGIINEYFKSELWENKGEGIKILLPLAGSGIRGVRLIKESKIRIKEITFNDLNPKAIKFIKRNIKLQKKEIKKKKIKIKIQNKKAQLLMQEKGMYHYIDIDPFGSSIPFIESAISCIHNEGILAITNTDTAALCGSYPDVCKRRYGSNPCNFEIRQEFGIRILIKRIQEIAAMQDIALIPIFSYSKDHYMRTMLKVIRSKKKSNEILTKHQFFKLDRNRILEQTNEGVGPNIFGKIWTGNLWDEEITLNLKLKDKFTTTIKDESKIENTLLYDPHEISKMLKISIPPYSQLFEYIKKKGFEISRTTFSKTGIRTNIPKKKIIHLFKKLNETNK